MSTSGYSGGAEHYSISSPYPYVLGLQNGTTYNLTGVFNNQEIYYDIIAKNGEKYYFNFTTSGTKTVTSNTTSPITQVNNITIGPVKGLHYNINYIKNGDYQGGTWYIIINTTQYAIQENIIYVKEYYNTTPYSITIVFGNYVYGGISYSPSVPSYSIPSTSNNTVYEIYYNISSTSTPNNYIIPGLGVSGLTLLQLGIIFVLFMIPAIAIAYFKYGKR